MNPTANASPWVFFALVFCLSVPFYVLGAAGGRLPVLTAQPTSALMAFMPMIAALILVYRGRGADETANLVKRALDFDRVRGLRWFLVAVCLLPIVAVLQYAALRLSGAALPAPRYAFGQIPVFFAMYFVGAIGEELGWQGHAFPGLRKRYSALSAAVILGVFWSFWHIIPFFQMGRTADWILWHGLSIVALRVIIVWLFVNAGQSIFIAGLFHTMINLPWSVIANYGAFYDPFITFVILLLVTGLIIAFLHPQNEPIEGKPHA
jgi:membrane protease YdiL (CAAX protease family)